MNNILKTLLQNKKIVISGFVFVLLLLILAFFPKGKEANGLLSANGTTSSNSEDTSISNTSLFSTYEECDGNIITLFKGSDNKFNFLDLNNSLLYSTTDNIEYFRVIDEDNIVYLSTSLDITTNKYISEVKYVNLSSKTDISLHISEKLFLETYKDIIYIVDGKTGDVLVGNKDSLNKYSISNSITNVIENKGKVFATNISVINNTIKSTVYLLNETSFEKIIQCEGKVQDINVDYTNPNVIYYSTECINKTTKETEYVVKKKYLVNLSPNTQSEEELSWLTNNVVSIKDKYITIDYSNKKIYLLNNNLSVNSSIADINSEALKSSIKESSDGSSLYYLNKSGYITKLQ